MRSGFRILAWALVTGYVAYILYVTVFGRAEAAEVKYNLMPFWSYIATVRGEGVNLMRVNYLNVAMFVPLGVLLWYIVPNSSIARTLVSIQLLIGIICVGLILNKIPLN